MDKASEVAVAAILNSMTKSEATICAEALRQATGVSTESNTIPMLGSASLANAGLFLGRLNKTLSKLETSKLLFAKRYHQWDGKRTKGSSLENSQHVSHTSSLLICASKVGKYWIC